MPTCQSTSFALLGLMLFCFAAPTQAAAYKCINPEGGTEYIDLPKEGYTCTEVRTVSAPAPAESQEESTEQTDSTDDNTEGASSEGQSEADARQANCEAARSNLTLLQSEQDVVITDSEGNKTLLNAEQRQARLAQAQKDIDYWCSTE